MGANIKNISSDMYSSGIGVFNLAGGKEIAMRRMAVVTAMAYQWPRRPTWGVTK